jgi:hypothetical protein
MSQHQITTSRTWQSIPVKQLINTQTGQSEVFVLDPPFSDIKVAEVGANNKWTLTNKSELLKRYNNLNTKDITELELTKLFYTDGTKQFNNYRANVINEKASEETKVELSTKENPVPGIQRNSGKIYKELNIGTSGPDVPTAIPIQGPDGIQSYFGSTNTIIKYPTNLGQNGQDYIEFSLADYGKRDFQAPNQDGFKVEKRKNLEIPVGPKIYLPIQPSISDQNDIGWGEEKLTAFQAIFANIATKGDGQTITSEMDKIMDVFGSGKYADTLRKYVGGQAVGINPIARTDGLVLNPNLELLFSGPSLRPFNFTFRLSPRDQTEADIVKNIIKFFKLGSTVRTTADGLFLKAPYVFNIKYILNKNNSRQDHPGLNKIKTCALRTVNVNYTPDGSYMTFEDGTMTSYEIALQFCELEPVYDSDYKDNKSKLTNAIGF